MTKLYLVCLLAACTSNPADNPAPTATPDRVVTMSCQARVDDFCTINHCDRPLEEAKNDSRLCENERVHGLVHCGDYDAIFLFGVDTSSALYYQDDQLVAIAGSTSGLDTCSVGPATFDAPFCNIEGVPLPACGAH